MKSASIFRFALGCSAFAIALAMLPGRVTAICSCKYANMIRTGPRFAGQVFRPDLEKRADHLIVVYRGHGRDTTGTSGEPVSTRVASA